MNFVRIGEAEQVIDVLHSFVNSPADLGEYYSNFYYFMKVFL